MNGTVTFHHIEKIELGPVKHFSSAEGGEFWCRDITITGPNGERFEVSLMTRAEGKLAVQM